MKSIRTPDPGSTFWDNYLSAVVTRLREKQKTATGEYVVPPLRRWAKRLMIPAAAIVIFFTVVLLTDRYEPILESILSKDEAFSATLDFVLEEHEKVLARQILDPTPLYTVEEIIPENWEESAPESSGKKE